jgi:hypothetical protein
MLGAAEAEGAVEVVVGSLGVGVRRGGFEESDEGGVVDLRRWGCRRGGSRRGRGRGSSEERNERVVHRRIRAVLFENGVEEVPDLVFCRGRRWRRCGGRRGRWSRSGKSWNEAADREAGLAEEDVDGFFGRVAKEDGGVAVVEVEVLLYVGSRSQTRQLHHSTGKRRVEQ